MKQDQYYRKIRALCDFDTHLRCKTGIVYDCSIIRTISLERRIQFQHMYTY